MTNEDIMTIALINQNEIMSARIETLMDAKPGIQAGGDAQGRSRSYPVVGETNYAAEKM
jgi:hypothetical protein